VAKKKMSIADVLSKRRNEIQKEWAAQLASGASTSAKGRLSGSEVEQQSAQFLDLLNRAAQSQNLEDIGGAEWTEVRAFLEDLSRRRVQAGFSSDETATFIFSLKRPLFTALKEESSGDAAQLGDAVWHATALLDQLGLHTIKTYQRSREEVINRQQQECWSCRRRWSSCGMAFLPCP
jgi:rsbT co-antagonist protein RsbR